MTNQPSTAGLLTQSNGAPASVRCSGCGGLEGVEGD